MSAAEAFMLGILGGMVVGGIIAATIVRHEMVPTERVISVQERLWRALAAVRLAMVATDHVLIGSSLEKAENQILAAGRILRSNLNDEGDR